MHKRRIRRFRRTLALALAGCLLVTLSAPAAGQVPPTQSVISEAVAGLQRSPVYIARESGVDPAAADRLVAAIGDADAGPMYLAVLPSGSAAATGGDEGALLEAIGEGVGREGVYAVVVGNELTAGATDGTPFGGGEVPQVADEAIAANQGAPADVLLSDFVTRLGTESSSGGGGGFGGVLFVLLLVGGGVAALVFARRRKRERRREAQRQLEEVRESAMDDLVALGDDLRALDLDVEMPGVDPDAKRDYERALGRYQEATTSLDRAATLSELSPVTKALEEGRYAIASARARLEGHPPPEHRPPCFFDPRHGPSVTDVEWAPPGGAPRQVPACANDAARVARGEEPAAREVLVGGRPTPYWNAPSYYGPWIGGYYGGFGGGLLEGMLLGSILGGNLGFGGWGDYPGGFEGGNDGGGDFGGFGGGDFGGGGFGGGDFGGGDFGGGGF